LFCGPVDNLICALLKPFLEKIFAMLTLDSSIC